MVINIDGAFHRVKTAFSSGKALFSTAQRRSGALSVIDKQAISRRVSDECCWFQCLHAKDGLCCCELVDFEMLKGLELLEKCMSVYACVCLSPVVDSEL